MTQEDLYDNVVASLIRFVEDFRVAHFPSAEYFSWDAHAQANELPSSDLIGLAGVGFAEDEANKYEIVCGIQLSTWEDPTLNKLTKAISALRGKLRPTTTIQVYDHETAEPDTFMITVTPQAILPVAKSETHTVQAFEVRLLLDPGAASSLR